MLIVALHSDAAKSSEQSLPEIARQRGGSATRVIDAELPISSLRDVVASSNFILRGEIASVETQLSADESLVETVYTIRPIEALKDDRTQATPTPGTVPAVSVHRAGGRLITKDGLHLATSVSAFPEGDCFALGEEVFVMMIFRTDTHVYSFAHGPFGAFRIRNGIVTPMTGEVTQRRKDPPRTIMEFRSEVQRLLR